MPPPSSTLVLGAGISGLIAAGELVRAGVKVTVLEKSRGVGGRMATRRIGEGVCDHGAQFFTAGGETFSAMVREWAAAGLAVPWAERFPDEQGRLSPLPILRYRSAPSMTAIPKHLASGLDVKTGQRALRVTLAERCWEVITDQNMKFSAEALLLTAPLPQSLALFDSERPILPRQMTAQLRTIHYRPCIALMLVLEGESKVPEPGAVHLSDGPVQWIADNRKKGISPARTTLTLQASADYSAQNYEAPDADIYAAAHRRVQRWLGSAVREYVIHRWRYSEPVSTWADPCLLAHTSPPLVLAGDAFGGGRIEGAALSGLAASRALLTLQPSQP
jgi:hypothetical protein